MAGTHGVKEHFLTLEKETRFHMHDLKALPFWGIKPEGSKIPCAVQNMNPTTTGQAFLW